MRLVKTILIIGILLATIGCQIKEAEKTSVGSPVTLTITDAAETKGYCTLTAAEEKDGYFHMAEQIFSAGIGCNTKDDCYNLLLENDEFRSKEESKSLAPEFYPYLNCGGREGPIEPNKMDA